MPAYGASFTFVADAVANRAAEVLGANVMVVDEHEIMVSRACPSGRDLRDAFDGPQRTALRIPIQLGGRAAHVIAAGHEEPISPRLAQALIDLVVTQAAAASLPAHDDLRGKLVRDLLAGDIADEAQTIREAQALGMDLTRPRAVILIDAAEYILTPPRSRERGDDTSIRRRARDVIQHVVRFFHLPSAAICTYLGDGEVAILKASTSRDLAPWTVGHNAEFQATSWANLSAQKRAGQALLTWLEKQTRTAVSIGIGRHHAGLAGLSRSAHDARAALSLGRRLGLPGRVYCLDDLGAAAFVGIGDQRTKLELAVRLLGPLDQEPDLLTTLKTFFEQNCCPSATASALAIHRNTLSYRLDKVASLTGLDPRQFDDAIQMRLALLLRTVIPEADAIPYAAAPREYHGVI
ncbi:MAG: PucR family transcriptional regulator [Chloroflexota bacterium]